MRAKVVVLDTNIWISYFIKAKFSELVDLIIDNDLLVYSFDALIEELTEVLGRNKFSKYLTLPISDYIEFHQELVTIVKPKIKYTSSPDPKDNFLFDLTIQHKARYLVTGDRKLLALGKVENVEIMSLTAFKTLVSSRNS
ncbi:putative toxin-antitoxin system toxin component, PIN family [Runella zeae]|uniref:putative toxin-antitoxin system toxin component, PIN family n=1 Tax=Runella zeae TaxID=94255 RepID=UPI00040B87B2|nr:putative toxin-antitoxin system toxin component, PIN family [Runella zeae]